MVKNATDNEPVEVRLKYDGREVSPEDADGLRDEGQESGDACGDSEVTPDQMISCPKCHKRFRVGKKAGSL